MEITTSTGEHFDIPNDYSLDLELINPILDDVGSQTAPGTLPFTPHNLRLLDHPDHIDRWGKYTLKRGVTLSEGAFRKQATQLLLKANPKDKIVSTFYMDEAIFYEKIKNISLTDINYGEVRTMPVRELFNLCSDVMFLKKEDVFHLFPVLVGYDAATSMSLAKWLNKINIETDTSRVTLLDRSLTPEDIDGDQVNVPFGYGISPFLKISFVLDCVVRHFGYTLASNPFEQPAFRHLVFVNDVIDAIVAGRIDCKQLVPGITVSDFVTLLFHKFGIKLIADEINKTILPLFIEDILNRQPDIDLSPFATGMPRIEWYRNEQLKLTSGVSIKCAKPSFDTYADLLKQHGQPEKTTRRGSGSGVKTGIFYYVTSENIYCIQKQSETPTRPSYDIIRFSPCFDYYTQKEHPAVECAAADEQLPMFWGRTTVEKNEGGNIHRLAQFHIAPGISEVRHVNTILIKDNEQDDKFGTTDNKNEMPAMFCFKIPELQLEQAIKKARIPVGTTGNYDMEGKKWNDFNLNISGEDSLYQYFWKKYDQVVCHSSQTVACDIKLSLPQLHMLKLHTPKLLFNQPVIIERIKCKIGGGKCEITEALFRTIRPYDG